MTKSIMLDSSLLGEIVHPRPNQSFIMWFRQQLESDVVFILPEIADYELRRELLHRDFAESIQRLNKLKEQLIICR